MKKFTYIIFCISVFALQFYAQQPTQEWVRRYSPGANLSASGLSVKQDSSGNIYVLVAQATDTTYGDYGLIKYNPGGNLLWSITYNSPGNLDDTPIAFEVTKSGDVYITGSSGINFVYHILTVKFNSNGILQWAREYNGGYSDGVGGISIDKQGNIVICGGSSVNNNISYALAVKYSPSGDSLWARKFTQYQYSYTGRLVIDDSSNVYVAGYYAVGTQSNYYLALKYNQNGTLQWNSSYGVTGYGALANSIAIDSNRNVYVVGVLNVPQPGYYDNVLVKINPYGILQWAKNYTGINNNHSCAPGPVGLSVTSDGNTILYSTICAIGNGSDIVTLSYSNNGDTNYVRRFPTGIFGIPNSNPRMLKIDKYGSAYIVGSTLNSGVIIKYLNTGSQHWVISTDSSSGNDIVIDSNQIYIAGSGSYNNITNTVTIKYNQIIGILPISNQLPEAYKIYQNYPNPFNSTTLISYSLPKKANIELNIYNTLGQFVKRLVNNEQNANYYSITINSVDLSSGVYFYSLIADNKLIETKKFIIIK